MLIIYCFSAKWVPFKGCTVKEADDINVLYSFSHVVPVVASSAVLQTKRMDFIEKGIVVFSGALQPQVPEDFLYLLLISA